MAAVAQPIDTGGSITIRAGNSAYLAPEKNREAAIPGKILFDQPGRFLLGLLLSHTTLPPLIEATAAAGPVLGKVRPARERARRGADACRLRRRSRESL